MNVFVLNAHNNMDIPGIYVYSIYLPDYVLLNEQKPHSYFTKKSTSV